MVFWGGGFVLWWIGGVVKEICYSFWWRPGVCFFVFPSVESVGEGFVCHLCCDPVEVGGGVGHCFLDGVAGWDLIEGC